MGFEGYQVSGLGGLVCSGKIFYLCKMAVEHAIWASKV